VKQGLDGAAFVRGPVAIGMFFLSLLLYWRLSG
jgi:hypothetical protein